MVQVVQVVQVTRVVQVAQVAQVVVQVVCGTWSTTPPSGMRPSSFVTEYRVTLRRIAVVSSLLARCQVTITQHTPGGTAYECRVVVI